MTVTAQRYEPEADLTGLQDHPRNPRRGDDDSVATSVRENGWYGAIVVHQETGRILSGHTRRRVLQKSGRTNGPVLWVSCDEETALRILLADNRTAELATWDDGVLLELLRELGEYQLPAVGFDDESLAVLQRQYDAAHFDRLDHIQQWAQAGMPAYSNEDLRPAYSTVVHFRSEEDADAFFASVKRPKARSWWWPEDDGFKGIRSESRVVTSTGAGE